MESVTNTAAQEVLRKLPGVSDANVRAVLRQCKSLAELASMPLQQLVTLLGPKAAAERLHKFLNEAPKALLDSL